jgi:pSer/pThr/pTyr-binding forkhead associated (FHA) protein
MHENAGQRRRRRMLLLREGAAAQDAMSASQIAEDDFPEAESAATPSTEVPSVEDALFTACRGRGEVTICVEDLSRRLLREQFLDRPLLTIGQGPENDLWLNHERILPRHALLVWLNGHVFFTALSRRAELLGGKGPVVSGWWTPNLCLRVGSFRLRLQGLRKANPPDFDPLAVAQSLDSELPRLELRFLGGASPKRPWPINRPLTLIGRGSSCKIRLDHPKILPVQAALIRTAGRLWLVNFGRPEQTTVNAQPIASAQLDIGDRLQFGGFQVEVQAASEWARTEPALAETTTGSPETSASAPPENTNVNDLIRQLANQHQKLLETHMQTLKDLERLANQTTDPHQLRVIQELIQKTYLAVGNTNAAAGDPGNTHP